jgi:hypothetical protein
MYRCPSWKIQVVSALAVLVVLVWPLSALAAEVNGVVQSGVTPIAFSPVTLYKAGTHRRDAVVLGTAQSDGSGHFTIFYEPPRDSNAVLYLVADGEPQSSGGRGIESEKSPVRLATVLGTAPFPSDVVINERTTVATAYAMAQFIQGRRIGGVFPGLQNAAGTVQNLVDIRTGQVGSLLGTPPNGELTSTMRAFNSLANMLAACVQTRGNPLRFLSHRSGVQPTSSKRPSTMCPTSSALRLPILLPSRSTESVRIWPIFTQEGLGIFRLSIW